MQRKTKQNLPQSPSCWHAQLHSHSWLLYFLLPSSGGNGGCGKSITAPLCLPFLCILFLFCRVAPSHGLQHFRINLLQHGSPWITAPSGHVHLPKCGPFHGLQCGCQLHCVLLQGDLLGHLEHLLLLWLWCLHSCFSYSALTPHCMCSILSFLTLMFPGALWLQGSAVPCGRCCGIIWNWLCSAWGSPLHSPDHCAAPHQHPAHGFNHNFSAAEDGDKRRHCLHGKIGDTNHFPCKTHWKNCDNASQGHHGFPWNGNSAFWVNTIRL